MGEAISCNHSLILNLKLSNIFRSFNRTSTMATNAVAFTKQRTRELKPLSTMALRLFYAHYLFRMSNFQHLPLRLCM